MEAVSRREIPYNYTSADDEQVVRNLLGPTLWRGLERLRTHRVTGRSARLLLRFIGDLFIIRRNPYLYQELCDSTARRHEFFNAVSSDLDVVRRNAAGNRRVLVIVRKCREALDSLQRETAGAASRQARIRQVLGAVIGEENVLFDPFAVVAHATDATDWRLHLPLAVVLPALEFQVAPLLRAAASLGLKVIPRGAGTGLTGGAVPLRPDCVMLNTEKLNRIRGIGPVEIPDGAGHARPVQVLEAEAGVVTEDAIQAAAKASLVFATDPTSAWACTLGGNLAENAGGKTAVLWGTAVDNVLSWRMALPSGQEIVVEREGHPLRKIVPEDTVVFRVTSAATGKVLRTVRLRGSEIRKPGLWKDITNKALGGLPGLQKEGTDGVITSARFVLHPSYEHLATACLEFYGDDMEEAGRVIESLSRGFVNRGSETLMALEHFDEEYVKAIDYQRKAARPVHPQAVLLIDLVAHTPAQLKRGLRRLGALLKPHRNTHLFVARDAKEGQEFWKDRKKLGAIARRTNAFKLNEDTVLPLTALAEFARHVASVNVEEERHNQLRYAEAVRGFLDGAFPDAPWLAPKRAAARKRCDETRKALARASRRDLRDETHVRALRDGLLRLFSGFAEVAGEVERLYKETRSRLLVIATHMHAGDGNVHVNIPVFSNDREMMRRAAATADAVMEKVKSLGGVVSGEHGIGITKLRHLEDDKRLALDRYRRTADPGGLMNPGKLSDLEALDLVFTPSFNLLELEARILQHGSLERLADMISKCVRCGRCKPDCCVFFPARNMFYHPRNKNLAVASLIEALLYEAQRFHSTEFESLRRLEEVADHCTICHKCLKPCPVDIDTGKVSVLEREILAARRYKHSSPLTALTLRYLASRSKAFNAVFRALVLRVGSLAQNAGALVLSVLPDRRFLARLGPLALLGSPIPPAPARTLRAFLPSCREDQALFLPPPRENGKCVFYFPGCGSERLQSDIALASIYVLLKSGTRVILPPPFLCCGYPLHANARVREHDRQVLTDTILFSQIRDMFRHLDFDAVAVSCGTCREALQQMGADGIFQAPLEDVSRFALQNGLPRPPKGEYLYHKPCHDSLVDQGVETMKDQAGLTLTPVPHCCSEAGTLAMSRPDISSNMLERKAEALKEAVTKAGKGCTLLTNCPSCVQGLGRNRRIGFTPRHIAVELARQAGGDGWKDELKRMLKKAETVHF